MKRHVRRGKSTPNTKYASSLFEAVIEECQHHDWITRWCVATGVCGLGLVIVKDRLTALNLGPIELQVTVNTMRRPA